MNHTTKLILFLTILSFALLSACGGQSSTDVATSPNADHLITFNADGIAVLRGYFSDGTRQPPSNGSPNMNISVEIPTKVDGIKGFIRVPLKMLYETVFSSSTVNQTDLQRYLIANPGSSMFKVFLSRPMVEVSFRKNGTTFETLSIHEVTEKFTLFKKRENIDGLFHKDTFGQWVAGGSFYMAHKDRDGAVLTWTFRTPIQIQGVQAEVKLEVASTPDTRIVTSQGTFDRTYDFRWDLVQIVYTRQGGRMIAQEITALP